MAVIYGHNEGIERLKNETMKPQDKVPISHNFYSETPEKHTKEKRVKKAIGGAVKERRHYPMTGGKL